MSASGTKRGTVTLSGGRNSHKLKVAISSKLETKETLQLKSATNRSDIHIITEREQDEASGSIVDSEFSTGKVFYENTFKLLPDTRMPTTKIETEVENVLREQFLNEVYDSAKCKANCQSICQLIKEKVKGLVDSRYKLVVVVHVGEKKGQGVHITSRCAWNDNFDDYVTVYFTNSSLFVQATIYALYAE